MPVGTSIRLASGEVLRQHSYFVVGYGHCLAREVRIGDQIQIGRKIKTVESSFTWDVFGHQKSPLSDGNPTKGQRKILQGNYNQKGGKSQ